MVKQASRLPEETGKIESVSKLSEQSESCHEGVDSNGNPPCPPLPKGGKIWFPP